MSLTEENIYTRYKLGKVIGEGNFSVIREASHLLTRRTVAMKIVNKTQLSKDEVNQLCKEIQCLKIIKHPNILNLYEVLETTSKMYLVLQIGLCDMQNFIDRYYSKYPMTEEKALDYFVQILSAISFCHDHHVIHRDLKPQNMILFNDFQIVKISDFGLCTINKESHEAALCGSVDFVSPEVLLNEPVNLELADIWGLGIILYTMVCSASPFHHSNKNEVMVNIIDCKYSIPSFVSPECKRLISGILVKEPGKRIRLNGILASEWVQNNKKTVKLFTNNSTVQISSILHFCVIEYMIKRKFSTYHEITQSLIKDTYNHISACYFLLAEILVRESFDLDYPVSLKLDPLLLALEDRCKNLNFGEKESCSFRKLSQFSHIKSSMQKKIDSISKPFYSRSRSRGSKVSSSNSRRHSKSLLNLSNKERPLQTSVSDIPDTLWRASSSSNFEHDLANNNFLLSKKLSEMKLFSTPEIPEEITSPILVSALDVFGNNSQDSPTHFANSKKIFDPAIDRDVISSS